MKNQVFLWTTFCCITNLSSSLSTTTNLSSSLSTTTPTTHTSPPVNCECVNVTKLEHDTACIKGNLTEILQQSAHLAEIPYIFNDIGEILNVVENIDCGCTDGEQLEKLEEETHGKIDNVLSILNSSKCECINGSKLANSIADVLARLDELKTKSDDTEKRLENCTSDTEEIEIKLDLLIASNTEQCDIEQLKEDNKEIKSKLDQILRQMSNTGVEWCGCEEQLNAQNILFSSKHDVILGELNELKGQGQQNANETKELPWKVPVEAMKDLPFGDCVDKAMCYLDDFFKDKAWRRMPTEVKKILITLYCKMGWKELQTILKKDKGKMKFKLEYGRWSHAATLLQISSWAERDPVAAEHLLGKLKKVKEKIAPKQ